MGLDSNIYSEIKKKLSAATIELRAAGINLFSTPPLLVDVIFHCQNSIEKSLMAFLIFREVKFDKANDFKKLCVLCQEADKSLSDVCEMILKLRPHQRGSQFATDIEEAKSVIITAEKIFQAVIEKIPLELFKN